MNIDRGRLIYDRTICINYHGATNYIHQCILEAYHIRASVFEYRVRGRRVNLSPLTMLLERRTSPTEAQSGVALHL